MQVKIKPSNTKAENDPELSLTCEFTAPYTPQQNGKIER
jgi:transposase InsO family protein